MASPLAGAWQLDSDSRDGIMILTDEHLCIISSDKDRAPWQGKEPTGQEAIEAITEIVALGGTYIISGSVLTVQRVANSRVDTAGKPLTFDFSVDGDVLNLQNTSGRPGGGKGPALVLRRVS